MGGLQQEVGSDLGTGGQPEVRQPAPPPPLYDPLTAARREGAESILEQYLADRGGIDQIIEETQEAAKTKKRGRKPGAAAAATSNKRARRNGHPADSTPPASAAKAGAWQPPAGSWEDHIESIDASEDEKSGKLIVYLNWKNGKKTKHNTDVIYRRCPQKVGPAPRFDTSTTGSEGLACVFADGCVGFRCCGSTRITSGS